MVVYKRLAVGILSVFLATSSLHAAKGMRTRTAEESAERVLAKKPAAASKPAPATAAVAAAPATPAAPPAPTTQSILNPTTAPAFADAAKAGEQYKVAEGLKISVFAAEPQLMNPVALSVDDQNNCWVVETFRFNGGGEGTGVYDIRHMYDRLDDDLASKTVEQRMATLNKWNKNDNHTLAEWPDRLKRIEDRDGNGRADHFTTFAEWKDVLDGVASGVITRRTKTGMDVYVANIPNLFLLNDKDNDGVADQSKTLSTGYGVRYSLLGHDLHGLRWGPDGKLYFSNGDRGMHVKSPEGKLLDFPDEGTVMRCDPDGSNLEVFARGLRNPQKLVFDQYGNLFTGDNNCDYGDLARWIYLVEGGDTGWRIGYQHLQTPRPTGPWLQENLWHTQETNTGAYLLPPIAHIASGPSGNTYYPGGGALPDKYAEHFFLTDFTAGPTSLVHSFALKAKGAGFEMIDRGEFVKGMVATDIDFAPDGGAYITDWSSSFLKAAKGRIYRVASPEKDKDPKVLETKKIINDGYFTLKTEQLQALLAHQDMRVRQGAQFELASRGNASIATFSETIKTGNPRMARIHAIWGLGQLARKSSEASKPLVALLSDADEEIRAQAAKISGDSKNAEAAPALRKLLEDPNARVKYFAAMALGKIGDREAVQPIIKMIAANADKDVYLRHAGATALQWIGDGPALLAAAKNESPAVRMAVCLVFRKAKRPEIAMFLHDASPAVVLEAARAINDEQIEAAQPQLAELIATPTLAEPVLLRSLNANFRLGGEANIKAVAEFAANKDASDVLRIEALQQLKEWDKPRGIDRVIGIWRPFTPATRDLALVQKYTRPILPGIVTTAPDNVRVAAIEVLKKVGVDDPNVLFNLATSTQQDPAAAAAALGAMDELKDPKLTEAVDAAMANGKGALRSRAIHLLAARPDAEARFNALLKSDAIADQQAAIATLGGVSATWAQQLLGAQLDTLNAGKLRGEIELELLEATEKSTNDAVKAKRKTFDDARPKDNPLATYAESLVGGDASAGHKIFFERQDVSCVRCHKIAGTGGVAGPDLSSVATKHERSYFLESIVNPNAQIAPGFENVTVHVKAGRNYSGVVRSENEGEIVIDAGDGATIHIDKKEVGSRTKGLSPMPQDISKTLSKRDVRDLVEFLSTLKAPTTAPVSGAATTQAASAAPAAQHP